MLDPKSAPAAPKAIASTEENSQASRDQVVSATLRWVIMCQTKPMKAASTTNAVTSAAPERRTVAWLAVLLSACGPGTCSWAIDPPYFRTKREHIDHVGWSPRTV